MTPEEVGKMFRSMPEYAEFVRDCYIDADVHAAGERFLRSAEFAETLRRIGRFAAPRVVLDLGAGNGIASYAFARSEVGGGTQGTTLAAAARPTPVTRAVIGALPPYGREV